MFIGGWWRYFILSGLSLLRPVDTKTDFNLNNIIPTLSLISISSVKNSPANVLTRTQLDLNSARWMPKLEYRRSELPGLDVTIIGPLQNNWPRFHYVIGISGILPYNRNVTLQTLELFFEYVRLYNAAASPASRLRSAGSLAIVVFYLLIVNSYSSVRIARQVWTWCNMIKQFFSTCYLTFFPFYAMRLR